MTPSVSIIIPAKDEEARIESAVEEAFLALETHRLSGEVIAIDDGSRDATHLRLARLQARFPSLRVVSHDRPWGFGASFLDGVAQASGDYVLLLPGDNENNADSVLRHVPSLRDESLLIAYVVNSHTRSRSRRLLSSLYTAILNVTFGLRLRYYNGTSIYRTSLLREQTIRSRGFFFSAEILLKLLRQSPRYREVPTLLNSTGKKASQALTWRSFRQVAADYLRNLHGHCR